MSLKQYQILLNNHIVQMNKRLLFIFSIFILLISSCTTTTPNIEDENGSYALSSDYKDFTLSWGYDYQASNKIMGYKLYSNGKITFFQQDKHTKEVVSDSIAKIPLKRILKILEYTNNAYLYTPALNEPGKECGFVELIKPTVNFYSKVKWNEHKTYGSETFRQLFDTLSTLVPPNLGK
jgi:hypothetical protein